MNTKQKELDPRTAYMLAWRDRHIERLREMLEGYEEERRLLHALLHLCAERLAEETGDGRVLTIPREALAARLADEQLEVRRTDTDYLLCFHASQTVGESVEKGAQEGGEEEVRAHAPASS